jgi:hypothetical protein
MQSEAKNPTLSLREQGGALNDETSSPQILHFAVWGTQSFSLFSNFLLPEAIQILITRRLVNLPIGRKDAHHLVTDWAMFS